MPSPLAARFVSLSLAALAALGAVALSGCAGSDAADPASGDPQNEEATTGDDAELRAKKCGGIAGLRCAAGYDCVITAHHPDAMGSCKKHSAAPSCATLTCSHGQHCMVMGSPPLPMCM